MDLFGGQRIDFHPGREFSISSNDVSTARESRVYHTRIIGPVYPTLGSVLGSRFLGTVAMHRDGETCGHYWVGHQTPRAPRGTYDENEQGTRRGRGEGAVGAPRATSTCPNLAPRPGSRGTAVQGPEGLAFRSQRRFSFLHMGGEAHGFGKHLCLWRSSFQVCTYLLSIHTYTHSLLSSPIGLIPNACLADVRLSTTASPQTLYLS